MFSELHHWTRGCGENIKRVTFQSYSFLYCWIGFCLWCPFSHPSTRHRYLESAGCDARGASPLLGNSQYQPLHFQSFCNLRQEAGYKHPAGRSRILAVGLSVQYLCSDSWVRREHTRLCPAPRGGWWWDPHRPFPELMFLQAPANKNNPTVSPPSRRMGWPPVRPSPWPAAGIRLPSENEAFRFISLRQPQGNNGLLEHWNNTGFEWPPRCCGVRAGLKGEIGCPQS